MLQTTVGSLLINESLPEDLRDYSREYDKKTLNSLLQQVASQYPEKYKDVSFALNSLGRRFAHEQGGFSFGVEHLRKSEASKRIQAGIKTKIQQILANDKLTPQQRKDQIVLAVGSQSERQQKEVLEEGIANNNPIALQILSGTRGKPMNLASLLGSDMLYADHRDRTIPIPVLRSYPEGLSQEEYWAGTYGARRGIIATKFCLAAGTQVLMADFTAKPIEKVEPGDSVFTVDKTERFVKTKVVRRYDNGKRVCRTYFFRPGQSSTRLSLTATPEHQIYASTAANNGVLYRGMFHLQDVASMQMDALLPSFLSDPLGPMAKFLSSIDAGEIETYDIEVEHPSHRFVLANMLVVSNSTQDAGYFSKQLNAAAHRLVVTGNDDEDDAYDPDSPRGYPVDADDPDSEGSLLAADTGPYKRNTVLTPKIIKHLRRLGKNRFLIRSPAVGGAPDGGLYARDVGVREKGSLPGRGEIVGLTAVQALCLDKRTEVRMADGSVKPIGEIEPGDMVLTCSKGGVTKPGRVIRRYDNGPRECVETLFSDPLTGYPAASLVSTVEHKMLWSDRQVDAESKLSFTIRPVGEETNSGLCAVTVYANGTVLRFFPPVLQRAVGTLDTCDIEVDHPDHLFVLANGLVVSNSEPVSQGQLCLAHGTTVRMADGSVKEIQDIVEGDEVLGADAAANTFPTKVVRTYDNGDRDCVRTTFWCAKEQEFSTLVSTEDHKILGVKYWRNSRFVESKLPVGEDCDVFYARTPHTYYRRSTQDPVGKLATYDIEVEHPDHLFVLENGLIVSNSAKHSGGVAGQEKAVGGFALLNQLIQVPKKMRGGAAHALEDGKVDSIEEAPAGGYNVLVGKQKHYVPAGLPLRVKVGDEVEAGDLLSDGIPNPATIVEHKGVGEGRRYFVNEFRKAMKDGGMTVHRRNVELLARGLVNHVQMTDETDDYVPDDIVPYSTIEKNWQPRTGYEETDPDNSVGKYLEKPVLHYSLGTKVKPSMLAHMKEFGVKKLMVHKEPPPFKPHMVRAMYQMQNDPDWMTQMYGSGLKKSLLTSTARGATSDTRGTSFVPSLAAGKDFGSTPGRAVVAPQKGYEAPKVPLPDPNLLSYKEAIGVDPTNTPPASPAPSLPSGSRATSLSGGITPGADYMRQKGLSGSVDYSMGFRDWSKLPGPVPPKPPAPKPPTPPQTPGPVRQQPGSPTVPPPPSISKPPAPPAAQLSSFATQTDYTAPTEQLRPNMSTAKDQTNAAADALMDVGADPAMGGVWRLGKSVVTGKMPKFPAGLPGLGGVTKGGLGAAKGVGLNPLSLAAEIVGLGYDVHNRGNTAVADENLDTLQGFFDVKKPWLAPVAGAYALANPVTTAHAMATPFAQVAGNAADNWLGTGWDTKDVEVKDDMLTTPQFRTNLQNTVSSMQQQLSENTDPAAVSRLQDQHARFSTLLKNYDDNKGLIGSGSFGQMFGGNLRGMKSQLENIARQLQDPNLAEAKRQELYAHGARLDENIRHYRSMLPTPEAYAAQQQQKILQQRSRDRYGSKL